MSKKTAPKPHSRLNLNLLYPQGISSKLPVQFLHWLINYGRFIVVAVEILVLATFVMRFRYDEQLADLKQKINSQIPYLESLAVDERIVRRTQSKLAEIKKVYTTSANWQNVLAKITTQVPSGVTFSNLTLTPLPDSPKLEFRIQATATTNGDLAAFLDGLKQEPSFQDITLSNINFEQGQILFSVTGTILPEKGPQ